MTEYLTIGAFAKACGVSNRTIERYVAEGRLAPAKRTPGKHMRFKQEQVEEFARCRENGERQPGSSGATATGSGTSTGTSPGLTVDVAEADEHRFVQEILAKRRLASLLS